MSGVDRFGQVPRVFLWEWIAKKQPQFTAELIHKLERGDKIAARKITDFATGMGENTQMPKYFLNKDKLVSFLDDRYVKFDERLADAWFAIAIKAGTDGKATVDWSKKGVGVYQWAEDRYCHSYLADNVTVWLELCSDLVCVEGTHLCSYD